MDHHVASIQDRLESSRERLLVAIESLPDQALLSSNAVGCYSVADLLAQFTSWEAELVTALLRLNQGKKPGKLLAALRNRVAYNEKRHAESSVRNLDLIFDDFQRVRLQLETWLEEFSDRDLSDPKRYEWFQGKSLAQLIAETTFDNEGKYLSALEAFAQMWNLTESSA